MQDTVSLMDYAAIVVVVVVEEGSRGAEHVLATCDTLRFRRRYTIYQFHLVLASCCRYGNNFIFGVGLSAGGLTGSLRTEAMEEASQKQTNNNNTTGKENKFHLIVSRVNWTFFSFF